MAVLVETGTTDVTTGYSGLFYQMRFDGTYFIRLLIEEPSLKFPRRYGDFIQVALNLPSSGQQVQIYHQPIWLDFVELDIRRDFGNVFPTIPGFRWNISGLTWQFWSFD